MTPYTAASTRLSGCTRTLLAVLATRPHSGLLRKDHEDTGNIRICDWVVLGIVPTIEALHHSIVNRGGIPASLQGTGIRFKSLRIESISKEEERGNKLIS